MGDVQLSFSYNELFVVMNLLRIMKSCMPLLHLKKFPSMLLWLCKCMVAPFHHACTKICFCRNISTKAYISRNKFRCWCTEQVSIMGFVHGIVCRFSQPWKLKKYIKKHYNTKVGQDYARFFVYEANTPHWNVKIFSYAAVCIKYLPYK